MREYEYVMEYVREVRSDGRGRLWKYYASKNDKPAHHQVITKVEISKYADFMHLKLGIHDISLLT